MLADVFANFADVVTRSLSRHLSGTFGSLMHEIYLESAHYCQGKAMFACKLCIAEIKAVIARYISRYYAEAVGSLLHKIYLEQAL